MISLALSQTQRTSRLYRSLLTALLFSFISVGSYAQTPLAIITGFDAGTTDGVAIALVEDLPAGTRIYLTTEEYNVGGLKFVDQSTGTVDEFVGYWESPTEVPEGMVLAIMETAPNVFSIECNSTGWFTFGVDCGSFTHVSGDFDLDQVNQIYLYSDNDSDPGNGVTQVHAALSFDFNQANHTFPASVNPGTPTGDWPYAACIDGLPKVANPVKRFFNFSNSGRFTNHIRAFLLSPARWNDNDAFLSLPAKLDTARFLELNLEYCTFSTDTDGDLICDYDPQNVGIYTPDNCPLTPNPDQADADNNGVGDVCEPCFTDNVPPVAIAASNFNAGVQQNGYTLDLNAVASGLGFASTDNCGIASYSISPNIFSCADIGNPKVVLTVTDNAGNTDTAQVRINVFDAQSPTISGVVPSIDLCEGEAFTYPTPTASDNCGSPFIDYIRSDGLAISDPFPLGITTVSCYAQDASGLRSGTETTTITVYPQPFVSLFASQAIVYPGYGPGETATINSFVNGGTAPFTYLWSTGETTADITVSPAVSTTYDLTITDAIGCTSTSSISICAINVACGNGPNAKVEICRNGKTKCVSISAIPTQLANGAVLGACGATAACSSGQIRVEPEEKGLQLTVFPNPFSDKTTVEILSKYDEFVKIDLFTLDGRLLREVNGSSLKAGEKYTFKLDGSSLSEGMYLLRLMSPSVITYEKLIVQ